MPRALATGDRGSLETTSIRFADSPRRSASSAIAWFGFVVALLLGNGSARFGWEGVGVAGPIAVQGVLLILAARPMRRAARKGRADGRSLARAATLLTWVFVISTLGSIGYTVATAVVRISASPLLSEPR